MGSLMQVFFSPRELFEKLDRKPVWVTPLLTVLGVTLVVTLVLLPTVIRPYTMDRLEENFQGPEEQLERIRGLVGGPILYASSIAGALLGVPAKILAVSGIYTLVLLPLTGEAKFRKLLSITSHSALISAFGGIVSGGIMLIRRSVEVSMGLNLFFPFLDRDTFLFRLLSQANFFTIWSLLVLGLGITIIGRISLKKSYVLVFVLWLVAIVIGAALGELRPGFSRFS